MNSFQPWCLPTAVGSLPHTDPREACDLILSILPEIPFWPQLPNRSPLENMYVQYFERFPGAVVDNGRIIVDKDNGFDNGLERLYSDYLEGKTADYAVNPLTAAGFSEMRRRWGGQQNRPVAIKGHITGPISGGLQLTDRNKRPVLYDEVLADALAKYLRLVVGEQERILREACAQTIMFVDEPYLSAVGSAFIQIRPAMVTDLLNEVIAGIVGLSGVHCCGNTDWSILLSTQFDVLSFDAYNFAETLALYATDVKSFLRRGGILAWGIVPTDERALAAESADRLAARLIAAVSLLEEKGIDRDEVLSASLVTPSCGLGPMSKQGATRALILTAAVSAKMRESHVCVA